MTEKFIQPTVMFSTENDSVFYVIYKIGTMFLLRIEEDWNGGDSDSYYFENKDKLKGFLMEWNEFTKTIEI
jgi:hypothetical protein